jgi:hypothetical protein
MGDGFKGWRDPSAGSYHCYEGKQGELAMLGIQVLADER